MSVCVHVPLKLEVSHVEEKNLRCVRWERFWKCVKSIKLQWKKSFFSFYCPALLGSHWSSRTMEGSFFAPSTNSSRDSLPVRDINDFNRCCNMNSSILKSSFKKIYIFTIFSALFYNPWTAAKAGRRRKRQQAQPHQLWVGTSFKGQTQKNQEMDLCLKCSCNKTKKKKLEKAVSHEVTGLLSCNGTISNKAVKKTDNCCCCQWNSFL